MIMHDIYDIQCLRWRSIPISCRPLYNTMAPIPGRVTAVVSRSPHAAIWHRCSIHIVLMGLLGIRTLTRFARGSHIDLATVLPMVEIGETPRTYCN